MVGGALLARLLRLAGLLLLLGTVLRPRRGLALVDAAQLLGAAALALDVVDGRFLALQVVLGAAAGAARLAQAVVDGEALVAGRLLLLEARLDFLPLGRDAVALGLEVLLRAGERAAQQGRQEKEGTQKLHAGTARPPEGADASPPGGSDTRSDERGGQFHVRRVSTTRRSCERNSLDCISFRRETVRGNSCARGPSVYNASGGTSADMISLTRRS